MAVWVQTPAQAALGNFFPSCEGNESLRVWHKIICTCLTQASPTATLGQHPPGPSSPRAPRAALGQALTGPRSGHRATISRGVLHAQPSHSAVSQLALLPASPQGRGWFMTQLNQVVSKLLAGPGTSCSQNKSHGKCHCWPVPGDLPGMF